MTQDLTVHMIVKNEEQWIWFAIESVIDHIGELLIFDTDSKDKTVEIIRSINSKKIKLFEKGNVTPKELVALRNEQIAKTKTSWFMLLDGDEVWTLAGIKEVISTVKRPFQNTTAFISKTIMPVGDLYHYQSETAGRYEFKGKKGHFNMRLFRKKKDYHWEGIYPLEAYMGVDSTPIQQKNDEVEFLKEPYWHMTHLLRSSVDTHQKRKMEVGDKIQYKLPEVFFKTRPNIVPSPWITFSSWERLQAWVSSPLFTFKRKFS